MRLSKQAIQLTIDDLHKKVVNQEEAIGQYRDEIEDLREEKLGLQKLAIEVEMGKNTSYDHDALLKNVTKIELNIGVFMKAIMDMEEKTVDYRRMIATLEVKRDTEGF